jgi:leucine dehydrogenase
MEITEIEVDGYERVVRGVDRTAGLNALIAVHSTVLGPALGGCRMWTYGSEKEALNDVLRLARGMTYKSALAQTGLGGGKAVIIGDSRKDKSRALFRAMGQLINHLEGQYITAEDVGTGIDDLDQIAEVSKWVSGRALENGGSGNPSPYTAHGTYVGLRACLEEVYGSDAFRGHTFAMQGLGAVALPLAKSILEAGGKIVGCDVNPDRIQDAKKVSRAVSIVDPGAIYDVPCDVFVPCALGAILNDTTIPRLKAKIVAGCANNQLAEPRHAAMLRDRGILYAPDYVINAGGIINVSCEFEAGGYDETASLAKIDNIYHALKEIFATARESGRTTAEAADEVAERRLSATTRTR